MINKILDFFSGIRTTISDIYILHTSVNRQSGSNYGKSAVNSNQRRHPMRNNILVLVCVILAAVLGGYILNDTLNRQEIPASTTIISTASTAITSLSVNPKIALVTGIEKSSKLITSETSLTCEVAVVDTWLDIGILAKEQLFAFEGTAAYITDLASFSAEDIEVDFEGRTITVYINEPSVYNIYIDPESIQTKDIHTGLLRFGEISLKEEDVKNLLISAEEQMLATATTHENMEIARKNNSQAIIKLFIEILKNSDISGNKIIVKYK